MSTSITRIVDVQITRETQNPTLQGFGVPLFLGISNAISVNQRLRSYSSIDEVQEDFGTTSEEYKASSVFFSRNPRPTKLNIGRWVNVDTEGELRLGSAYTQSIQTWNAVIDGAFRITIDGVTNNVEILDFTTATTFGGIATIIENGLGIAGFTGVKCTFSETGKKFIITSGTTGNSSSVSLLTTSSNNIGTDISGVGLEKYLDGSIGSNSEVNNGLVAESIQDALGIIEQKDNNWYMLCCTSVARDNNDARLVSEWCEARIKLFIATTNDINVLSSNSTTDIASELSAIKRNRTALIYNGNIEQYPDMAMASFGATTVSGSATWKFKALQSVSPSNLTTTEQNTAESKSCNVYITIAGINMVSQGVVSSALFIDEIRGVDDLQANIQLRLFKLLSRALKVPENNTGEALLFNELSLSLERSVANNFLTPITVFEDGEVVRIDPAYEIKVIRTSPTPRVANLEFTARLSGAVHKVVIRGTVNNA